MCIYPNAREGEITAGLNLDLLYIGPLVGYTFQLIIGIIYS